MANMSGWGVALLTTIALFASTVSAGTEAAPEVTDPAGDATICAQPPACSPNQDTLDALAAWVDVPDADHLAIHMKVAAASTVVGAGVGATAPDAAPLIGGVCLQGAAYFGFNVHFSTLSPAGDALVPALPGTTDHLLTDEYVSAQLVCDTAAGGPGSINALGFYLIETDDGGPDATNGHISQAVVPGSIAGNVLTWVVPRSDPLLAIPAGAAASGYKVGNLWAQSYIGKTAVLLVFNPQGIDRAPNADFGSEFVLGSETAQPIYSTVTTPAFTLVAKNPTMTNQTYIYNWTNAQSDLDLAFGSVAKGGTAHVLVKDSSNATVLDKTFPAAANGTMEIKDAKTGKWQVTVTYAGFMGDLALSMAKHEAGSTVTTTSSSTSTTIGSSSSTSGASSSSGSSSTTNSGTGPVGSGTPTTTKGSPGIGLALLLAGMGLAVALRRRL
jgi:hypothetical protein